MAARLADAVSRHARTFAPGPYDRSVRTATGEVRHPPADWSLLPPGDPALTRR